MPYVNADQGPPSYLEYQDCTVHALRISTRTPYQTAHALLAAFGRKPRRGCDFSDFLRTHNYFVLGHYFIPTEVLKSRGIRTLLIRNPQLRKGTFVLQMCKHVATLRNGMLIDTWDTSKKDVLHAWKVLSE